MKCSDCQDLLSEYIDNELSEIRHAGVRSHLKNCSECNLLYEDLNQIVYVSRDLPSLAPQNELWAKLEAEIKSLTSQKPAKRQQGSWEKFWTYRLQLNFSMPQLAGGVLGVLILALAASISY